MCVRNSAYLLKHVSHHCADPLESTADKLSLVIHLPAGKDCLQADQ